MTDSLLHPLNQAQFRTGLAAGGVAAAAVLVVVVALLARRRSRPIGLLSFAFAPAGLYALQNAAHVKAPAESLAVGLGALAGAGGLPRLLRLPFWAGIPFAAGGGLLVLTDLVLPTWQKALLVAALALAVPSSVDMERRWPAATPALFVISVGGMYATVPDTEAALALLGASALMVVFGWPVRAASVGLAAGALLGLFAWVVAVEGVGRETSVVGATACLGLLGVEPLAYYFKRRFWPVKLDRDVGTVLVVATHFAAVLFCSRVAGLTHDLRSATLLAAGAIVLAVVVVPVPSAAALAARTSRRR